jgi:hypothetical protein
VEIGDLPDRLDAAVPFNLDINIGVLCLKGFFHLVKRLEQAACRYYFEYRFLLLHAGAAPGGAAQQDNEEA